MKTVVPCLLLVLLAPGGASVAAEWPGSCSTFMLETGTDLYVGHNLDESPELPVPGLVCVNKRGAYREGITWYELIADPDDYARAQVPFAERPEPRISWRSRYGSITFNSEGLDFPDGGMNEVGLTVFEMSLGGTRHKIDPTHPTLFICLWIQYQLDNCATVAEVIRNAHEINQQGWSWHYFVADADGNCAIIEYLGGEVAVYTGDQVRYPVLCNAAYAEELRRLDASGNVAGRLMSLLGKTPRFVRAARMLDAYDGADGSSPRGHALEILREIQIRGWNKWAILCDVRDRTLYFDTDRNREPRHVSFASFDLGRGPDELLDIHADLAGDLAGAFVDYTYERNLAHAEERARGLFAERFKGLIDSGVTPEVYARRFADYSARMRGGIGEAGPPDR